MTKLKKNRVTIIGGLLAVVAILLLFSLIQCRHSKMSLTSIFCNYEKSALAKFPPEPFSTDTFAFADKSRNRIVVHDNGAWRAFETKLLACLTNDRASVSIVHIGDSHLQADFFPGELRRCLHRTFNAVQPARGLIFPYAVAKTNNPNSYRVAWNGNWTTRKALEQQCQNLGLSGIEISTADTNATISIKLTDNDIPDYGGNILRIFYGAEAGCLPPVPQIVHESNCAATIDTNHFCISWALPRHTDSLTLAFCNVDSVQPFCLQGIALTTGKGIEYHTIGVNGARVSSFLKCDHLEAQLSVLKPDLVIVSLGTNDSYTNRFDSIGFCAQLGQFVGEIRAAQPNCAILLTTPGNNKFKDKTLNTNAVSCAKAIKLSAEKLNCCTWDFNAIMGSPDSLDLWNEAGLITSDFVHLTRSGYKFQARLLMDAIMTDDFWLKHSLSDN